MPRKPTLRAVTDADIAPMKVALSITEAARAGDRLAELEAMRLILAGAVQSSNTPPRDLASLTRRLIEVGREVEELKALARQEGDGDDQPVPDEAFDASAI